ncbi:MAG: hypothetical protein QOF34_1022 [Sphingomonadales bacterium]|jgi:uncharacterized membrane protein|nr:hypothetical protein [Sphingomonadales bacterium]
MDAAATALKPRADAFRWARRVTPAQAGIAFAVLALGVRAIGLGSRPLWLDEAYSAWFSARGWHYLWAVVPTYEVHPPFYYSLLKLWRGLFGGGAVALRSLSILFGIATIPVMIAAAREQERQQPSGRRLLRACAVAFIAAFSPMLVLLGQEARPYPLLIFAYALATLGLLRLLREFRAGTSGEWRSWLLLGVGTEVALWAHALGILYAICLMLALAPTWLARPLQRGRLVRGAAVATLAALAYAPCLVMMASRTGDWGTGWLSWKPVMLIQLVGLYSVPGEALTAGSAVAAVAILLLIKRALQSALEQSGWTADRALLLLWLGPPLVAVVISATFIPVFLPRTLSATLVPAYLAIAGALARTSSAKERSWLAGAIAITLVPTAVQVATRPGMERWDEVGSYLKSHVRPGDEVWVYPNDSALPLGELGAAPYRPRGIPADYPATGVKGLVRAGSPAVVLLSPDQSRTVARDPAHRQAPTIWLVTRQSAFFDPRNEVPTALAQVRQPGKTQQWGYIAVQPFTARSGR